MFSREWKKEYPFNCIFLILTKYRGLDSHSNNGSLGNSIFNSVSKQLDFNLCKFYIIKVTEKQNEWNLALKIQKSYVYTVILFTRIDIIILLKIENRTKLTQVHDRVNRFEICITFWFHFKHEPETSLYAQFSHGNRHFPDCSLNAYMSYQKVYHETVYS